jgi:hypothetical protein
VIRRRARRIRSFQRQDGTSASSNTSAFGLERLRQQIRRRVGYHVPKGKRNRVHQRLESSVSSAPFVNFAPSMSSEPSARPAPLKSIKSRKSFKKYCQDRPRVAVQRPVATIRVPPNEFVPPSLDAPEFVPPSLDAPKPPACTERRRGSSGFMSGMINVMATTKALFLQLLGGANGSKPLGIQIKRSSKCPCFRMSPRA